MNDAIANAIDHAHDAIDAVENAVNNAGSTILKATKGNGRFKNSSVWVELPNGRYKHVQSGKTTSAARLAGYTEVFYL